ncbi:MAG TPA: phosphatidylglycerol lysyltransferase domain-containing protein [Candidatus Saccharimonadales bacterium]|nr:phosphatidylglycerol lysyltransferase domain-containing protein [Candidatus Saccharimonadales bacterium]
MVITKSGLWQRDTRWAPRAVAYVVGLHGLLILASSLFFALHRDDELRLFRLFTDLPLLFGLTLIYLSTLLRRYKRTAWGVTLLVYIVMLGLDTAQLINRLHHHYSIGVFNVLRLFVLPLAIVAVLALYQRYFTTKSDVRTFRTAIRFTALVLLVTFVYGTAGFMLMDQHDFHQEISLPEAMHRTVDQFDITTTHPLTPYTRRARVFLDSLNFMSVAALAYVAISLFQPIRARLEEHSAEDRGKARRLLEHYGGSSEDIFKLWPEDKTYFFNSNDTSAIAYKVQAGVALVAGDPLGDKKAVRRTFNAFKDLCVTNDWQIAFIHIEPEWNKFYEGIGLSVQKIGEEAIVDVKQFYDDTRRNKYFRNIKNRFEKLGYTAEMLQPPHSDALLTRLKEISDDWLGLPGRVERGFVMGYFNSEYMQRSSIMVARDDAGTIRAFLNQIESFDVREANFDLLRYSQGSPGNINDFVLVSFLEHLHDESEYERLNIGLCPLAGLDKPADDPTTVDRLLRFVYSNGDRFYSFSGLHRFKAKYDPVWHSRFVAYPGGVGSFTRIMNALMRAMKVKV